MLTVEVDGERLGLTIGSLVSLSLDPPLVGVSVSGQAAMHELLRRADGFALSLLAGDQEAVAQHFARGVPPIALWEGISVRDESESPPFLAGAVGWLRCRLWHECEAGDHTFFIGEVLQVESGGGRPLVYYGQSYAPL